MRRFAQRPVDPGRDGALGSLDVAVPVVDGTPPPQLVGRQRGLIVTLVAPPSRHWLGESSYGASGRAVVIDGECGIAECCVVMARIEIGAATVSWSDFFARGRPQLPAGLAVIFDRAEYEQAIAAVAPSDALPWPVGDGSR